MVTDLFFLFGKKDLKDFANHRHDFLNVDRRQYFSSLGPIPNFLLWNLIIVITVIKKLSYYKCVGLKCISFYLIRLIYFNIFTKVNLFNQILDPINSFVVNACCAEKEEKRISDVFFIWYFTQLRTSIFLQMFSIWDVAASILFDCFVFAWRCFLLRRF